jgi:hypothetical protein
MGASKVVDIPTRWGDAALLPLHYDLRAALRTRAARARPNHRGLTGASHHARVALPAALALRLTSCAAHKSCQSTHPSMGLSPHFFLSGPTPTPTMPTTAPPLELRAMPTQRTHQMLAVCVSEGGACMAWPGGPPVETSTSPLKSFFQHCRYSRGAHSWVPSCHTGV